MFAAAEPTARLTRFSSGINTVVADGLYDQSLKSASNVYALSTGKIIGGEKRAGILSLRRSQKTTHKGPEPIHVFTNCNQHVTKYQPPRSGFFVLVGET